MRIIFRYGAMQDVVDFALETLRDRSPVGSSGDKHPGPLSRQSQSLFKRACRRERQRVEVWRPDQHFESRVLRAQDRGLRTQTIAIPAGLVGVAIDATNGFDPTMISFQATAA
jgi:hypothetical protein